MFKFFKKKNRVTDDVVLKLMPADKGDFEGLALANGQPQDLYRIGLVQNTLRGGSTQHQLIRCRDDVKTLIAQIGNKDVQLNVYYVNPRQFEFTCHDPDGALVRHSAKIDVRSLSLADWLRSNIRCRGENITGEKIGESFDGKPLPAWLVIDSSDQVADPKPEEDSAPEPEKAGVEALVPGTVVFGRYRIEEKLGEGGMGMVFLATDTEALIDDRRKVILKVLHLQNAHDPKAQEMFVKEANTLAAMRDDRIAACYNCRMYGDVPILVMEYVEGVSLDKYLEKKGTLDEATTRELLRPIAGALDYAHKSQIYHLDVKPQNIIVRKTPKKGYKTCLLDFGIARRTHADGSMTYTMSISGTPPYMSQQQRNGESATSAMDIFALAVTAYQCLVGKVPYPNGQTASVSVCPLPVDNPFCRAIMSGLDIDPKKRPATCIDLIDPKDVVSPFDEQQRRDDERRAREEQERKEHAERETKNKSRPQDLEVLSRSFRVYREMLAQSAAKWRDDEDRAKWLRDCQAELRDLLKKPEAECESVLVRFFTGVGDAMRTAGMTADDIFRAADRLEELRRGLPDDGGPVWRALKDSVS